MPEVFSLASGEERPSERVVLNSVAPNEEKTSGTQGNPLRLPKDHFEFPGSLIFPTRGKKRP